MIWVKLGSVCVVVLFGYILYILPKAGKSDDPEMQSADPDRHIPIG